MALWTAGRGPEAVGRGLWVLLMLLPAVAGPARAAGTSVLADAEPNTHWNIQGDSAVFGGGRVGFNGPTLVFDKSALLARPVQLTVQTDSDQMAIRCGYNRIKVRFADLSKAQSIVLDAPGRAIRINGKTTDTLTASWQRLLERADKPTLELNFGRTAKKVSVKWQNVAPLGPADGGGRQQADGTGPAVPLDPLVLRNRLRRAVYPVRAGLKDRSAWRVGLGTVLSADGLVLLPLDLVQGAECLEMMFGRSAVGVGLVKIDPLRNLAAGRLDAGSGVWRPLVAPLELAGQDPGAGQEIQVVEWSVAMGLTTAGHKVVEVEEFAGLDRDRQRVLHAAEQTRWIVTDENLSIHAGGTPAVNAAGQVVGLSYWTWPQRKAGAVLLAGSELRSFLADLPPVGLRPETVQTMLSQVELPASAFPRLRFEPAQPLTALRRQLALVNNHAACALCKGRRQVHRSVVRGYEKTGGLKKPIEGTDMFVCPRCEGSGYNAIDAVYRMLGGLAGALSQADEQAAEYRLVLDQVRRVLDPVAAINPLQLRQQINQYAAMLIAQRKVTVGDGLVFIGRPERAAVLRDVPELNLVSLSTTGRSSRSIFSSSTDRRLRGPAVLVHQPRVLPDGHASLVLVGGALAGYVALDDNQRMPVLQNGFVIEVQEPPDNRFNRSGSFNPR